MINSVKTNSLYVGNTIYKTDMKLENMDDTSNVVGTDVNGNILLMDSKREMFFKKGHMFYSVRDLGKKSKLLKKCAYKVLFKSEIEKDMKPKEEAIINKSLKPLNVLEELNNIDSEDIIDTAKYFYDNLNSQRVLVEKVKKLNSFIK